MLLFFQDKADAQLDISRITIHIISRGEEGLNMPIRMYSSSMQWMAAMTSVQIFGWFEGDMSVLFS